MAGRRHEKQPWGKFYWADWLSDPRVKMCSLSAQGLWMRMLCIAAQASPVGYVVIEDVALGAAELAEECGKPLEVIVPGLAELQRWGVFSTDRRGRIYSRRMIKDVKKAKIARENGHLGGNPSLGNRGGNQASDNRSDKPQRPEARTRARRTPQAPQGGPVKIQEWAGPREVRDIVLREFPKDADGYLMAFTWREVPDRELVTASATMHAKLKPCEAELRRTGWKLVLRKEAAA